MSTTETRGNLFYGGDGETFLRQRRGNLFTAQTWKPFWTADTWKPFFIFARDTWKPFAKVSTCLRVKKGFHVTAMERYRGNLLPRKSPKGFHVSLVHYSAAEDTVALLLLLLLLANVSPAAMTKRFPR